MSESLNELETKEEVCVALIPLKDVHRGNNSIVESVIEDYDLTRPVVDPSIRKHVSPMDAHIGAMGGE